MMDHFTWRWSEPHGDWYYATQGLNGNVTYHWARAQAAAKYQTAASPDSRIRSDASGGTNPPESVSFDIRAQLPNLIPGTPETGWYEQLDPSYRMRSGQEAYGFFVIGRVFAMLHVQSASPSALPSDCVTVVRYGEHAFSQIRRFVVVEVRRGFVYACPLSTYSGRATTKVGCIPSEHSIVYLQGSSPRLVPGESPLSKDPIRVNPADGSIHIDAASRIHFAKVWPVEMNVKVKDIGIVDPADRSNLLRYYREENNLRE